jgi:hypothetical protein
MSSTSVEHLQPFCERHMAARHSVENTDAAVRLRPLVDVNLLAERHNTIRQTLIVHFGLVRNLIVMTVLLLSFVAGLLMPRISSEVERLSAEWLPYPPSTISSDSYISEAMVGAGQTWNEVK